MMTGHLPGHLPGHHVMTGHLPDQQKERRGDCALDSNQRADENGESDSNDSNEQKQR
jgi:hypothetical protein